MTKVCHITSVHRPLDTRIFYKECVSLAKAGYQVFLVERGESGCKDGVEILGCGQAPHSRLLRMTFFAFRSIKRALSTNAQVYHIHDPELLPWAILLKQRGGKVIFDSHENYPAQISVKPYLPPLLRKVLCGLYRKVEDFVLRRIDGAIAPCTFSGRDIFADRVRRSAVVDNFPVNSEFYDLYDEHVVKEDYFCHLGGITEARGVTDIVRAAITSKIRLVLAGPVSDNYLQKLKAIPDFDKWVEYRGILGREDVRKVYAKAMGGVFVLRKVGQYTKADNFGIKVTEFMAMALPFVVARYSATEKLAHDWGCCLTVDSGNVKEIAQAMRWIVEHREEASVMGQRGRNAVAECFNWKSQEERLLSLYKEVVSGFVQ